MARQKTRILWGLLGICLLVGSVSSLVIWLGPQNQAARAVVRQLAAVSDILAIVFWLLVFAVYWTTHPAEGNGDTKDKQG